MNSLKKLIACVALIGPAVATADVKLSPENALVASVEMNSLLADLSKEQYSLSCSKFRSFARLQVPQTFPEVSMSAYAVSAECLLHSTNGGPDKRQLLAFVVNTTIPEDTSGVAYGWKPTPAVDQWKVESITLVAVPGND